MKIIKYSLVFLCGALIGIGAVMLNKPNAPIDSGISVKHIDGASIRHDNYTVGGDYIKFITYAEGKGSAVTSISKDSIPESYSYRHNVHSFMLTYGYRPYNAAGYIGAMYMYRYKQVYIGCGIDFGKDLFGIKAGAGFWF